MAKAAKSFFATAMTTDGKLAGPLAAARGMTEARFLYLVKQKKLPVDYVARFAPVKGQNVDSPYRRARLESQEIRLAKIEAKQRELSERLPVQTNVRSSVYWGVIAVAGDERLAMHATGKAYLYQLQDPETGQWEVAGKAETADFLPRLLIDAPSELLAAALLLPLDPVECHQTMTERGRAFLDHKHGSDNPPCFDDVASEVAKSGTASTKEEKALASVLSSSEPPSRGKVLHLGWWLLTAGVFGVMLFGLADCLASGPANAEVFNMR